MAQPGFFERHDNVFLYVPNLIGYFRVLCMLGSFIAADISPAVCLIVYFVGFFCDELDGRFARMFNQSSRLGAVLDMVTDRSSTTGLLALLCKFSPAYSSIWVPLIALDVSSHWYQMYATLACGETTHKESTSKIPLIKLYYSSRIFMGFCCVSCEVLYLCIYAVSQPKPLVFSKPAEGPLLDALPWITGTVPVGKEVDMVFAVLLFVMLPGTLLKQVINMYQMKAAMDRLAALENKKEE